MPVATEGSMQKLTVVNEDAFKKISALENELAHLRAQIAAIVAVPRSGNDQPCKPVFVIPDTCVHAWLLLFIMSSHTAIS